MWLIILLVLFCVWYHWYSKSHKFYNSLQLQQIQYNVSDTKITLFSSNNIYKLQPAVQLIILSCRCYVLSSADGADDRFHWFCLNEFTKCWLGMAADFKWSRCIPVSLAKIETSFYIWTNRIIFYSKYNIL